MMKHVFIFIFIATTVRLLPRGKNVMRTSKELEGRLPEGHYEKLCGFSPDGDQRNDDSFWKASEGVHGLLERQRVSFYYLKLIQAHRREGALSLEDASSIWAYLLAQIFFTALALSLASIGGLWRCHHRAARRAVGTYCNLLLHTNTLCFSATCHKCPLSLPDLL